MGYDPFEETKIFRSFCLKHFELFSPWNGRFFQGETLRLTLIVRKQYLRLVWCCSSIKWNGSTNSGWSIWPSQIQGMNQGPAPQKRHDILPTKQQPNYDFHKSLNITIHLDCLIPSIFEVLFWMTPCLETHAFPPTIPGCLASWRWTKLLGQDRGHRVSFPDTRRFVGKMTSNATNRNHCNGGEE